MADHEIITGVFMICISAVFGFVVGVTKADEKFFNWLNGFRIDRK